MNVLRVFNNNVVLARDEHGTEVILTGRGLGFQKKPGDAVDPAAIVRTFVPSDGRSPDHLGQLLADIPPQIVAIVGEVSASVQLTPVSSAFLPDTSTSSSSTPTGTPGAGVSHSVAPTGTSAQPLTGVVAENPALLIALADHIAFAVKRARKGIHSPYPLEAKVRGLYPAEFTAAHEMLDEINARFEQCPQYEDVRLPADEAVAITLHLVNAAFTQGNLAGTYMMTGVIQQMIDVIEDYFGIHLEQSSVNVGRFITHLRYLFVRIAEHRQLDDLMSAISESINSSYPEAAKVARVLAEIIELRTDATLSTDEVAYLSLHIARLAQDARG
ncbi:beta-glucoside operon transcriptional antiterminator [Arcanobacterium wilhelmae]|uniref:Beta-glucoside operon transcriptional antiterminator n=1 Tax=Arcanobacterium wilhelmae TaxID=1803177 RepID=A0ABT9NDV5_9ACTO|nr:PRD domain-containing protein [Arcanobacterium wilhelmae]MDP9801556.1 beta-glucoside operon transcriptional antiterminator [Arcanobacterium wilhelmae]